MCGCGHLSRALVITKSNFLRIHICLADSKNVLVLRASDTF